MACGGDGESHEFVSSEGEEFGAGKEVFIWSVWVHGVSEFLEISDSVAVVVGEVGAGAGVDVFGDEVEPGDDGVLVAIER